MEDKKQGFLRLRNDVSWKARNLFAWKVRNLFAWKARNLNLVILIVFNVACVIWTFDIFGSFKTNAWAFQVVYKGLKLIIEDLGDYLIMKKRDCFVNKQNRFLKVVLVHVQLWNIAWQGYE